MKGLKFIAIGIGICFLCIAASVLISSDSFAKDPSNLDCKWKCDEKKKQCVCTGKDCQTCVGKKGKAYGGGAMVIGLQTCSTKCNWECSASVGGQCYEWEKNCITVCRGR